MEVQMFEVEKRVDVKMDRKRRIGIFMVLFVFLAAVILIKNLSDRNRMLEYAEENMEAQLNSDLAKGYISEYEILSCEYFNDVNKESQNVRVRYKFRLGDVWNGDPADKTGLISLEKQSRVFKTEEGTLHEDFQEYIYFQYEEFIDDASSSYAIAGLNTTVWRHPYVAEIRKEDVKNMSSEEVVRLLFKDWLDSFQEWGNNSFIIIEYKNFSVGELVEPWEIPHPVSGIAKKDITYPESVKTWHAYMACDFKIIGAYDDVLSKPDEFEVLGGGGAFGNDGAWQERWVFQNPKAFVMTEWKDRYTLETAVTCMEKIKSYQNDN